MQEPLLSAHGMSAGYGSIPVVRDVDIAINPGEIAVVLGANGAGKTTTLLSLVGELPLMSGHIQFRGDVRHRALFRRARSGLQFVGEDRFIFPHLSTLENLTVGMANAERGLQLFPELEPLLKRPARLLSGGEQQILALAKALSANPKLIIADELSFGLAPLVVQRLLMALRQAADQGAGVLIVEQQVRQALAHVDRGYVMRRGHIELEGSADHLLSRISEIEGSYLSEAPIADPAAEGGHFPRGTARTGNNDKLEMTEKSSK